MSNVSRNTKKVLHTGYFVMAFKVNILDEGVSNIGKKLKYKAR